MGKCANCGQEFVNLKKFCDRGVPRTYAKIKNKVMARKIKGIGTRNKNDADLFVLRFNEIEKFPIGKTFVIEDIREDGTHGQEYREALNVAICLGKIEKKQKQKPNSEEYYEVFSRVEKDACPFSNYKDVEKTKTEFCSFPIKEFKEKRVKNGIQGDVRGCK